MATQANALQDASGMTFDSSPVQQDTPVQGTQVPQAQTQDSGMTFDSAPVQQSTPVDQLADSRTPDEQAFLKAHPDHVYLKADPKFPNRQEGIYPKNEAGLNDPEMEHHPVDPELLKHSVQYGVGSAAAVGGTTALASAVAAAPEAIAATKNFILKQLAEQSPELFGHEAVKATLKKMAMEGLARTAKGAAWAGGAEVLHSIWDDVFGSKK